MAKTLGGSLRASSPRHRQVWAGSSRKAPKCHCVVAVMARPLLANRVSGCAVVPALLTRRGGTGTVHCRILHPFYSFNTPFLRFFLRRLYDFLSAECHAFASPMGTRRMLLLYEVQQGLA